MFDIGWSELLVIAIVAIVVVGPKELPKLMRTFGHYTGKVRRAAGDFQRQFENAMRESEMDEVRKNLERIHEHTRPPDLGAPLDKSLMLPKPKPAPSAGAGTPAKPKAKRAPAKAKRGNNKVEPAP
jgi:sec-independent protein translocase protein TatB